MFKGFTVRFFYWRSSYPIQEVPRVENVSPPKLQGAFHALHMHVCIPDISGVMLQTFWRNGVRNGRIFIGVTPKRYGFGANFSKQLFLAYGF
jgi:hypothetical protein